MKNTEFRAFLDMLMCNDPWCVQDNGENQKLIEQIAERESKKRDYDGWIEAYHSFVA